MTLTIEGASEVEHRVDAGATPPAGGVGERGIELLDVKGATQVGSVRTIGLTESLVLQPEQREYGFRYRARQSADRGYRCPIWLPAVPADGESRAVALHVELPQDASPRRSMPALSWSGSRGTTTIGHLPSFVHVPFAGAGASPGWDVGALMDWAAIGVFALATAAWVWRRKR